METFRWLNDWAGQNDVVDTLSKNWAVFGLPVIAALGVGALLLLPVSKSARRWRLVLAWLLAMAVIFVTGWGVNFLAWEFLKTPVLRPRPYIARPVNLLLTEPSNNSFPSVEAALCFACAATVFSLSRGAGAVLLLGSVLLGVARVFCGVNYPTDVLAGAVLGVSVSLICCALLGETFNAWSRGKQVVMAVTPLLIATVVCVVYILYASPYATPAMADNGKEQPPVRPPARRPPRETTLLGMHQERAEKRLLRLLRVSGNEQRVVHVGVAQNEFYQVAEVWFDARWNGVLSRRRVERAAAKLIHTAFYCDSRLQEVNVVGILPLKTQRLFVVFNVMARRAQLPTTFTPATDAEFLRCFGRVYYDERRLPERGFWTPPASEVFNGVVHADQSAPRQMTK